MDVRGRSLVADSSQAYPPSDMTVASPNSAQLPRPGDMIAGKYVLDRLLGQGGMGAVFAARHLKLSKSVAIKIMLADTSNPEASTRFINEGRAAANIQNEHVVRVDDVDEEKGYAYMVLELLEGEDLAQVLERELTHRLQPHVAVGYVLQALKGVMQAHAIGIVHRDLKPSNLFLAKRKDGSVVVKVLDFGISKAQGSSALAASPNALTSTKAMLGSPLYMSPEQLRSSKSVDHRADIWAIGVILYELITGTLPFMGDNLGELFAAILEMEPVPLRQRVDGVHPGLEEIVLRCLARRPENRFQTVEELANALAPYATPQSGLNSTAIVPPNYQPNPQPNVGVGATGAMTPNQALMQASSSHSQIATGTGPRVVGGTVALGAMTPTNMQATNGSGWQSTGGGTVDIPKSKAPLAIGLVAAFVFVAAAAVGIALVVKSKHPTADTTSKSGSALATSSPPPAPSSLPSLANSAPATPMTAASTAPLASVTGAPPAPTAPTTTKAGSGHHSSPPPIKVDPSPKPPEPKPPEPKPTAPKPANTSGGGLQNAR